MVSTFLTSRAAVPHLQAAGGGAIIAISSVLGLVGLRQRVAYCASKAGILGMVRAMALDLASHGIRVNAICPGNVETELVREIVGREPDPEAVMAARRRANPIQRSGETREIAAAAVYFASDDAAWTTGQYLTVDGGFTIR
jgi:NAD(P)-dependent dehydrogenase (short-subunit alcohol dehydrogenase family)